MATGSALADPVPDPRSALAGAPRQGPIGPRNATAGSVAELPG
jgi:hypothetical protein